jgi:hypothetical protein
MPRNPAGGSGVGRVFPQAIPPAGVKGTGMPAANPIELSINLEKLAFIVIKAREFDAKVDPVEPDPGSNPADDNEREVLEDYSDDATYQELVDALTSLNDDEIAELMALVWVGRGDFDAGEWDQALSEARDTRDERAVSYLTGIPNLGDELEEGLSSIGISLEDAEKDHL